MPFARRIVPLVGLMALTLAGCDAFSFLDEKKTPLEGERKSVFSSEELAAMRARGAPKSAEEAAAADAAAAATPAAEPKTARRKR